MPDRKEDVPARSELVADIDFRERTDFTYRKLAELDLKHADVRQSLFIGALIIGCTFDDVDFRRSDFSGTKIVRSRFHSCRFKLTELRSCEFLDCVFDHCDFSDSHWFGTKCIETTFRSCSFEQSTVLECRFQHCSIAGGLFKGASITLSAFEGSRLGQTGFADCTAMFLFFDGCDFQAFAINAESLGLTFGLTVGDLQKMDLIYLGEEQAKPADEDLVSLLATTYSERRWFVGRATIDINFERRPVLLVLKVLASQLLWLQQRDLPYDLAELRFFFDILERLQSAGRCPLFGLSCIGDVIREAASREPGKDGVAALLTRFDRLFAAGLDQALSLWLPVKRTVYALTMVLEARPARPLDQLMAPALETKTPIFVAGYEGSWTEIWTIAHEAIFTVELILFMTTGAFEGLAAAIKALRHAVAAVREPATHNQIVTASRPRHVLSPRRKGSIAVVAEETRMRGLRFSPEAVARVDAALLVLAAMSDEDLAAFSDYAPPKLRKLALEPVKKQTQKRPRARRRSA